MGFSDIESRLSSVLFRRMDLRSACLPLWLPVVGLIMAAIPPIATGYETYSVEHDCTKFGNISVSLSAQTAAILRATERTSYSLAMDCRIRLSAPDGYAIVVSVREIGFRTFAIGTCQDYLQVKIDGNKPMCAHLFRVDEEHHFFSSGTVLEILYHVSQEGMDNSTLTGHPGFHVTATAFTTNGGSSECPSKEEWFRCKKGHCVWSGFRCDSHNNCGDLSDEQDCAGDVGGGSSTTVLIILGVLILLLLCIMCIATLLCSKNEQVRRLSNRIRSRTLSYWTNTRHSR